ncbi:AI-2E family transporter [Rhodovibrionaceae bacterium A322]
MIIVTILVSFLVVAKAILIPFTFALMIWVLLNALIKGFQRLPVIGEKIPTIVAFLLSFATIILALIFIVDLISDNVSQVSEASDRYQENLNRLWEKVGRELGVEGTLNINEYMQKINVADYLKRLASVMGAAISNLGVIAIYVAFMLVEQKAFPLKMRAIYPDESRRASIEKLLSRIVNQVQGYLWIKTQTSVLTGVLSYGVLSVVGVDFAAFWGFIIFLLNYIPTVGSLIGVVFPALLTLVQFDSLTPFLIVTPLLSLLQFTIGNVLEPAIMGRSLNVSSFVVILALIVWGFIWGIPGMFLGVPLTISAMIVLASFPTTRPYAIAMSSDGQLELNEEEDQP